MEHKKTSQFLYKHKNIGMIIIIIIALYFRLKDLPLFVIGGQDPWYNTIRSLTIIYNKLSPGYFIHPSLYYYIQAAVYYLYYLVTKLLSNNLSLLELFLVNEANFILLSRLLSVVFGTISIFLVYKIGKTFWSTRTGLIAALCFSLLPLHISCSKQIRVDAIFVFFLLLSFYWILKVYEDRTYKNYIFAAITLGLCISANYNGALLYLPLLVALSSQPLKGNLEEGKNELYIYLVIIGSIGIFLLTSPYVILDFETFKYWFKFQSSLTFKYHPFSENRKEFYYFQLLFQEGFVFFITAVFCVVYLIFKGDKKDRFILFFPIVYFIIFTIVKSKYDRFILPALPFFCLAIGISYEKFRKEKYKIIFIAIIILSILQLLHIDILNFKQPPLSTNPRESLFNFICKNIAPKSTILIESDVIPLLQSVFEQGDLTTNFQKNLKKDFFKTYPNFNHKILKAQFIGDIYNYSPDLLRNGEIEYVVISTQNLDYIKKHTQKYPEVSKFYSLLRKTGKVVYKTYKFGGEFRIYKICQQKTF